MVTIRQDPANDRVYLQFLHPTGVWHRVDLGNCCQEYAESVADHVERLLEAKAMGGYPDVDTAVWLLRIDEEMARQFVSAGLVPPADALAAVEQYVAATFSINRRVSIRIS